MKNIKLYVVYMLKKFLLSFLLLPSAYLFSTSSEMPMIIDFGNLSFYQGQFLCDDADIWNKRLGQIAYEMGNIAFNDSPEIGAYIHLLQKEYLIDTVIETDTSFGATAQFFSLYFDKVHTIEASMASYEIAKDLLKHQTHVQCHLGSSEKVLHDLLPTLKDSRLLFYLAAHIDYEKAQKEGYHYWPILEELDEIGKTHSDNCIIVIDDFQLPNTTFHGYIDSNGKNELSHELIRSKLKNIFSKYTFHYLLPKNALCTAKFVAIPKKWEKKSSASSRVEVISGFNIFDFPIKLKEVKNAGLKIQMKYAPPFYDADQSQWSPEVKKILVFGWTLDDENLSKLPKEKMVYFLMEPFEPPPSYYDNFSYIYTINHAIADNHKIFKLYYPYLMPMRTDLLSFEDKKLCVMISGSDNAYPERKNELYSERMKMVEFFETKPEGEFDIYGRFWVKRYYRDFRGAIPGDHSGEEKISTLKKYRFSICFENTKNMDGYITEKIFSCFAAGCVPIYWGPENIEKYIPKTCFIDFRDFKDKEELYQFIKNMPKDVYETYLDNIRCFLTSEQAQVFSPAFFEKTIFEAIMRE